jgi:hypothetical protein
MFYPPPIIKTEVFARIPETLRKLENHPIG